MKILVERHGNIPSSLLGNQKCPGCFSELLEIENKKKKEEFEKLKKTVKPCPLCGKPVNMFSIGHGSSNYHAGSHIIIVCNNCKLKVIGPDTSWKHEYDHNDEVREFIKKWNTRVEVK